MQLIKSIIKEMRVLQWIKNLFVVIPLVFDRQLFHPVPFLRISAGFILFSLVSSSVYFINDILDIEADRKHPKKRFRPIAAGKISLPLARGIAIFLVVSSCIAAFFLSPIFAIILLLYFLINLAYSTRLKHVPVVDVMIIAAGFLLRVVGGSSLIIVERFSPWLYIVTTLLALFFGLGKRLGELATLQNVSNGQRKVLDGYSIPFLDQLITIVSATTLVSYSFYTFSAPNLPENHAMMLTIPFVLFAIFRYIYLMQIKNEGGAPDEVVMKDRPLQITFLLFALAVLIIFYFI
jgi:4-hydroxybenzoate polyprenyltransferase